MRRWRPQTGEDAARVFRCRLTALNRVSLMSCDAKEPSVRVTEESIALLIDRFYVRIRQDSVLAKVFEAARTHALLPSEQGCVLHLFSFLRN